jgi:molybdopterin synthase catalytic subunit
VSIAVRLERASFDPREELGALLDQAAGTGAVVSFVGVARPAGSNGDPVQTLVLEDHPTLTSKSLREIADATSQRFGVSDIRVVHRCGAISPGEPIVFAGAASAHRRAAFEAADYLMDRLKTEAVLWKREVGADGSTWIEPTEADYADRERWS